MRRRPPRDSMAAASLLAVAFVVLLIVLLLADDARGSNYARARAAVCDVFGKHCAAALRVVRCETGGTFSPWATGSAGERGIFQIHPVHFGWLDERRLWIPRYNARIAFRLSHGGHDWSAWTCRP
jgi:Lysozyme like domain